MMDSFKQNDGTIGFRNVQITDLEDAVVLPPDSPGLGKRLSGNHFWRSPEAWARAAQHTPADIFSFGLVVSFQPLAPTTPNLALSPPPTASLHKVLVAKACNTELTPSVQAIYVCLNRMTFFQTRQM